MACRGEGGRTGDKIVPILFPYLGKQALLSILEIVKSCNVNRSSTQGGFDSHPRLQHFSQWLCGLARGVPALVHWIVHCQKWGRCLQALAAAPGSGILVRLSDLSGLSAPLLGSIVGGKAVYEQLAAPPMLVSRIRPRFR
jgi:hypothetical protein